MIQFLQIKRLQSQSRAAPSLQAGLDSPAVLQGRRFTVRTDFAPSQIMSRNALVSPNKQAVKKAQGLLKTLVSTYGNLILSWQNDTQEVKKLVYHYKNLIVKQTSVYKATMGSSYFSSSMQSYQLVGGLIMGRIYLEMESTLMQIKTFEKRLRDTHCAMTVTYEDAMKCVFAESVELFDQTAIFTSDHVLDMQQLHKGYTMELERKLLLTQCLYSNGDAAKKRTANDGDEKDLLTAPIEQIDVILKEYADSSRCSCIPEEQVEIFLIRNNIRGDL